MAVKIKSDEAYAARMLTKRTSVKYRSLGWGREDRKEEGHSEVKVGERGKGRDGSGEAGAEQPSVGLGIKRNVGEAPYYSPSPTLAMQNGGGGGSGSDSPGGKKNRNTIGTRNLEGWGKQGGGLKHSDGGCDCRGEEGDDVGKVSWLRLPYLKTWISWIK
eukprot:759459-Hanusia_phi.AAC.4